MARQAAPTAGLVLVAIVVTGFALNAAVRMPCANVCGSDIGRLYDVRDIDRAHPPFFERELEYPPLIGIVMYGAALPFAHGFRWPFLVNAAILTALAAATTWLLWRRYGNAARRWALAPPLFVYGLTNWDLLAIAPATAGLLTFEAGHAVLPGVLLGAGASAKLFPALYVPILAAHCAARRAWRRGIRVVGGAALGIAACALSVYVFAPDALGHFLYFHRARGPSRGSVWYYVFRNPAGEISIERELMVDIVNGISLFLVAVAITVVVVRTARDRLEPIAACALATIAFVVTNKIYSPQYDLWILPFLVMLPVRTKVVVHFSVSSLLAFLAVATEGHLVGRPVSLYVVEAAVAYRLVVLALIARVAWHVAPRAATRAHAITVDAGTR